MRRACFYVGTTTMLAVAIWLISPANRRVAYALGGVAALTVMSGYQAMFTAWARHRRR